MPTRTLGNGWLALLLMAACSCGPVARPEFNEWREVWFRAQAAVPSRAQLVATAGSERCDALLVAARRLRLELLPTPSDELDEPIQNWIEKAQQIGFECPIEGDELDSLDRELADLSVLNAEIDAALATLDRVDEETER